MMIGILAVSLYFLIGALVLVWVSKLGTVYIIDKVSAVWVLVLWPIVLLKIFPEE